MRRVWEIGTFVDVSDGCLVIVSDPLPAELIDRIHESIGDEEPKRTLN